jgi:glycosyltransferase involved in cell wall biosynthesis
VKKPPLISFIVSVYNLQHLISNCLDSIVNQPFSDYEIVLVNNSSTDNSHEICLSYAARYKQIRYFALDGDPVLGRATIYGSKKAEGEYVQFVDGDDMLAPNAYGEVERVLKTEKPEVVFGNFTMVFDDNILNFADRGFDASQINNGKDNALRYLASAQPFILATWRLIMKREICLFMRVECGDLPPLQISPSLHFDVCSLAYTLVYAKSIYYVNKPIYVYRVRASSISRITPAEQVLSSCKALFDLLKITATEAKTQNERAFVRVYANQFYYQICAALVTLSDKEVEQSIVLIEDFFIKQAIPAKHKFDYPFLDDLILNVANALKEKHETCLNTIKQISQAVAKKGGGVYLSPTGNIGKYLKTAFEKLGVSVAGFFDNDSQKHGERIGDAPIYAPSAVKNLTGEKTVLLGTRYENVGQELKEQFLSLNVSEKDIVLINF